MRKFTLITRCVMALFIITAVVFVGECYGQFVFSDHFNRTTLSPGGTPSMTYTTTTTGLGTFSMVSNSYLQILNGPNASSGNPGRSYVTGPLTTYASPFNRTLNLNTGIITWTFNVHTSKTSTADGFNDGKYGIAVVLASTGSNLLAAGVKGYAVVYGGTGANFTKSYRLVRFNNGLAADANLTNIIASGDDDFAGNQDYISIRVTYNPTSNSWSLFLRDDGIAWVDPSIGVSTLLGTNTDNTHTGLLMSHFGFFYNHGGSSGVTAHYDNFDINLPVASPTLYVNPSSLTFANQQVGTNSTSQSFNLSGLGLTGSPGNITVNAPSQFQVSKNNSTWGSSTTIAYASATLTQTPVYVRYSPTVAGCAVTGNITLSGAGVVSPPTVALSGLSSTVVITNPAPACSPGTVNITAAAVTAGSTAGLNFTYWTNASATTSLSSPNAVAVSGTYYIKGTNPSGGCTDIKPVVVTVNQPSGAPTSAVATPAAICSGSSITLTQTGGTRGTGATWHWYTDAAMTIPAGTSTSANASLVKSPVVTTTYYVRAEGGTAPCSTGNTASSSVTVTVNTGSVAPVNAVASPAILCNGESSVLTQTGGTLGTGASWHWYTDAAHTLSAGTSIAADANLNVSPVTTTTYYVRAEGGTAPCAIFNTASKNVTITVNPRPAAVISGGATYCGIASPTTLSIVVNNAPGPWSGTLSDGTPFSGSSSPISVSVAPLVTTIYTIATLNNLQCSAIAAELTGSATVTVNPLPADPTVNVVQPTCESGTGTINITAPLGDDISYSIGGAFQNNPSFPAVVPNTYTVSVQNSYGCFSTNTTTVTVNPQPIFPATPTVNGIVNVCQYVGTTDQVTYTAFAAGATGYNWILPPNVVVISGAGTSSLTVTFSNGFASQANKQLRVTANSLCGTSAQVIYFLAVQAPITPRPIIGPTDACPLLGGPAQGIYTINKVPGASSYIWTAQSGTTTITHPLSGENDTTISVLFATGFTTSSITVQALNVCGVSGVRSLTVTRTAPSQPGLINGPINACEYIAPGGIPAIYSVVQAPGVTYTWSVPAGATGLTGQGTNTISFIYPNGFTTGTVSVTGTTGCGSATRSLLISKLNPATPSVIDVIQTHYCGEPGGRVYSYTLSSMPANATSVLWTIQTAAGAVLLSGQGTTSVSVSYPDAAVNGAVTAQGINNCGVSSIRSTAVKLAACPPPEFAGNIDYNSNEQSKMPVGSPALANTTFDVQLFPNPCVSDSRLKVITTLNEEITVRIFDNQGRIAGQFRTMPYQTLSVGSSLKAGTYLVEIRQGTQVKTTKLVKF